MPAAPPRELKIGVIVEETLAVLERCWRPILIFVVALTVINGVTTYYGQDYTAILQQLAKSGFALVVGIIASYLLLEAMLKAMGYKTVGTSDDAFLAYCGLSILYTLGVLVGFILLIIPGLFLIARWIVAQQFLLARGTGIKESFHESWERTRGNEFPILIAMLALLIVFIALSVLAGVLFEETDPIGVFLAQLASSVMSGVSAAMGVALFGLMVVSGEKTHEGQVDPRIGA